MFTVISTFSGCGGSSLGYQMAGGKILLAVEWDENAVKTYKANFPDTDIYHGDIAALSVEEVLNRTKLKPGELDIFDGSPPCQGFSTAGKRDFKDNRNQLFKEYCRLLKGLQPKCFVMENVSGMVKGDMKIIFAEILTELKACGYQVKARLLNAKNYKVPQNRQRVIFIGVRENLNKIPTFPLGSNCLISVKAALTGVKDYEDRTMKDWLKIAVKEIKPLGNSIHTGKVFKKYKGTTGSSIGTILLDWNKPSPTICKSEISVSGLIHPSRKRYLNMDELKRLNSFPDDYKFTDRVSACMRIGNSVPPLLMKAIASHIRDNILKPYTTFEDIKENGTGKEIHA